MNFNLTPLRKVFFVVAIASLAVLIACTKEAIQPIPPVTVDTDDAISDPAPIEEVNTDEIAAGDITLETGTVGIEGTENFDPQANPAEAAADGDAVESILSPDEETFWDNISTDEIEARIESGNAGFATTLTSVYDRFAANSRLSKFLPTETPPNSGFGGRLTSGRVDSNTIIENDLDFFEVNQQQDDCFAGVTEAFNERKAKLDSGRDAQLTRIEEKYTTELATLQADADALRETVNANQDERRSIYIQQYTRISTAATNAFNAGDLTATEFFYVSLLNKVIYALNLQASSNINNAELSGIQASFDEGLADLNGEREALESNVLADYNAKLETLQTETEDAYLQCHNQGAFG